MPARHPARADAAAARGARPPPVGPTLTLPTSPAAAGAFGGTTPTDAFGVYVHIPFCVHRCDYCAFATWTDRSGLMDRYTAACITQLERDGAPPASSVFFGGGTPSLLPARDLVAILAAVSRREGAEVTVECNPETVTPELLAAYAGGGVTRLSFGVQSMDPGVLAALGRRHDPASVVRALRWAGDAGFTGATSVDLILGAAGETLDSWRQTLEAVLDLDPAPAHVSAYALTVEPGTPLAADPGRHPDPDDQADKYLLADDLLTAAGLAWYELSNWARPGAECAHNQLYWDQGPYQAVGCAAHGHRARPDGSSRRWWNLRTPERYIAAVEAGRTVEAAGEELDEASRRWEALTLALRTRSGVPASALPDDDPVLDDLVARVDTRRVLTREGRLLANEVAARLLV